MCSPARASSTVAPAEVAHADRPLGFEGHRAPAARSGRCIASWARSAGRERLNRARARQYTKPGWWSHGAADQVLATSPGLLGPTRGRTSTATSCSTSSAAAVGWMSQTGRMPRRWPVVEHRRGLPGTGRPSARCSPARDRERADDGKCSRASSPTSATRSLSRPQCPTETPSPMAVQDPEVPPRLPWPLRHSPPRITPSAEVEADRPNTERRHGGIAMLTPSPTCITAPSTGGEGSSAATDTIADEIRSMLCHGRSPDLIGLSKRCSCTLTANFLTASGSRPHRSRGVSAAIPGGSSAIR